MDTKDERLDQIEHGLADENDYYQAGMTEEQLRRAAAIILAKECPLTGLEHAQRVTWSRTYRNKHKEQ